MTWRTRNGLGGRAGPIAAVGLAALACWACGGPPELAPGQAVEGWLEPGESVTFRIDAGVGKYVRVEVEPIGDDGGDGLAARLSDPRGGTLHEAEGIRVAEGGVLAWTSDSGGQHLLELAFSGDTGAIGYRTTIAETRPARGDDGARAAAETAGAEAVRRHGAGDTVAAVAAREREIEHWRRVDGGAAEVVEALLALVEIERGSDRRQALARCEEALSVSGAEGLATSRAVALHWKGRLLRPTDCAGASEAFDEALKAALAQGELSLAGDIWYSVGQMHRACGSPEGSAAAFRESIELGRLIGAAELQASGHRELAILARRDFDLEAAGDHLERARGLVEGTEHRGTMADVLFELATLARAQGRLGEARALLERSRRINEQLARLEPFRSELAMDALLLAGVLSLELRRPDEARGDFTRLLEQARARGDLAREVEALRELGAAEERDHELSRAEELFRRSLATAELLEPGPRRSALIGSARFRLGNTLLIQGRTEEAIPPLEMALALQEEAGRRVEEAMTRGALGTALAQRGDLEAAMVHLEAALAADRAAGDPVAVVWSLLRQAEALAQAEPSRARELIEEAIETLEGVRSGLRVDPLRAEFADGPRRLYDLQVDLLIDAGDSRAAFTSSERGRARALLDLLAEARAELRAEVDPLLREQARVLEERLNGLGRELSLHLASGPGERTAALRTELAEAEREWWRVEAAMRERSPRYEKLQAQAVVGVERLQADLSPRRALIEYWLGRKRAYAFVVTPGSFEIVPLGATADLLPLISEFRRSILALQPPERFGNVAHRLFQAMVAPAMAAASGADELVVVADGPLHLIPFEALVVSAPESGVGFDGLDYLANRASINYAPSATVLASLRTAHRASDSGGSAATGSPLRLVVFADPRSEGPPPLDCSGVGTGAAAGEGESSLRSSPLAPIKASRDEARAIARPYGDRALVYAGDEASESRVKRDPEVAGAERLHFAVHGLACETFPERSGLVLAQGEDPTQDGFLQAREIFGLRLSADLVVLSACDSGTGKLESGEGVIGLARAFFYAGTPTTVVSLWPVPDRSTADLMKAFYTRLDTGDDKAVALQRARRSLIESGRYQAPFYWAPFVLLGSREVHGGA